MYNSTNPTLNDNLLFQQIIEPLQNNPPSDRARHLSLINFPTFYTSSE